MHLPESYVYLDWAATTPLCQEACDAMAPFLVPGVGNIEFGANANSLHTPGRNAFSAMEDARVRIARAVGAGRPSEVVFTSGATESNNTAILGLVEARVRRERQRGNKGYAPHFITSAIEHDAVLSLLPLLRDRGCEVTVLKPDRGGHVPVAALREALRPETALVSLMWANNEVGSLQDIPVLADAAHADGALFHTDATQAVGKVPVDLRASGVDAASFSSHKVCGPKGVGALYLKTGVACEPLLMGGGQEQGRRSGTQNVAGIVGFAAACEASCAMVAAERERLQALRDELYARLCDGGRAKPSAVDARDAREASYLPNIVNVLVPGIESETLILQLDLAGFAVSGGSACSTGSLEPSHVLSAMGIARDEALCSLRVSMGRYTTHDDVVRFVEAFRRVVE